MKKEKREIKFKCPLNVENVVFGFEGCRGCTHYILKSCPIARRQEEGEK